MSTIRTVVYDAIFFMLLRARSHVPCPTGVEVPLHGVRVFAVTSSPVHMAVSENRDPNARILIINKGPKIRYPEFSETPIWH